MQFSKVRLSIRKNSSTLRVVQNWNQIRGDREFPSLELYQTLLDKALGKLI